MTAEEIFPYSSLEKVIVNCPVCGSDNPAFQTKDRYRYPVKYVKYCKICHMGYMREQLTRQGYQQLYDGAYRKLIEHIGGGSESVRDGDSGFGRLIARRIKPCSTILDAGGSSGVIGKYFANLFEAHLTVLDPAVQEMPTDVTSIQGYLEDPIPGGSYDLALCIDTADHLTNPLAAFANLRAVSGTLVINFIDVHLQRFFKDKIDLKIDHPLYWSARPMIRALKATGWTPTGSMTITRAGQNKRYKSTMFFCQ